MLKTSTEFTLRMFAKELLDNQSSQWTMNDEEFGSLD